MKKLALVLAALLVLGGLLFRIQNRAKKQEQING